MIFTLWLVGEVSAAPDATEASPALPMQTVGIPGSATLPPHGSVVFEQPQSGAFPEPELVVNSATDVEVEVALTKPLGGTFTASTTGGALLLISAPDSVDAQCGPVGDQGTKVVCSGIEPAGPPLPNFVTVGSTQPGSSTSVLLPAGWSMVAGPAGTSITGAVGDLYTYSPQAGSYQSVPSTTPLSEDTGYWAYFTAVSPLVLVQPSSGGSHAESLPQGQYRLLGNPFPTDALITGRVDAAFAYDPASGYLPAQRTGDFRKAVIVPAGHAVWLYSIPGNTIGLSPSLS